ncbi:hypothetical protein N665_0064s0040 [Sinapis alba]|nr:hypothetical protein N665_0064s0040 [Sinapis alba]
MGRAISKTVNIVELIKRRIPGLHQITSIGSTDITDTWEPLEEGLLPIETTRHVSLITITLSKKELNISSVGYQCPIPIEMVKPLAEYDHEGREGSPRGRARRDRGRGRGGRGDGGYVNVEYDDGAFEPERSPGRGRGGRRGRSGRGRGGYSGPQPHYEAQQDGADYGHNAPQQYREYDDGGMDHERRGRGRGSGGGRRGGRGRGGYNGHQPHYESQQDGGDYGYTAPPRRDHGYDDGGMNPERSSGRGRGGGRRGGRGRGGYSGTQPHYEAQQHGGDYGYTNAPPQDYGYDAPHQGRGGRGGRGRGGRGRGGGRGGFNRSDGPPNNAAA